MKKFYFLVMKLFSKNPSGKIYMWAYLRCFRLYLKQDPIMGYWKFSEDYFKK